MMLAGWGNYPRAQCRVLGAQGADDIADRVGSEPSLIARGLGRAYGDAALNPQATLSTNRHNRIVSFDPTSGRITCESGVLLADLVQLFTGRGWFPPVTPGTKMVSIGGMIAADVHGKNHHSAGSFCDHVESLDLVMADGRQVTCSPHENADIFAATCGGMGLTGVITSATFHMLPVETGWIRQKTIRCGGLDETMGQIEEANDWTYSASWIDCLATGGRAGRSVLFLGEHAALSDLPAGQGPMPKLRPVGHGLRVPVTPPGFVLNRYTVSAFNEVYFRSQKPGHSLVSFDPFFYPLDAVLEWNRLYGRRGFLQYQCVFPKAASAEGVRKLLARISQAGIGSFLAVLKLMGRKGLGVLSFPMEGYTLAIDLPLRAGTFRMLDDLDAIVEDHSGRLYLAKDAHMRPSTLRTGYQGIGEFADLRHKTGSEKKFSSLLSKRLSL